MAVIINRMEWINWLTIDLKAVCPLSGVSTSFLRLLCSCFFSPTEFLFDETNVDLDLRKIKKIQFPSNRIRQTIDMNNYANVSLQTHLIRCYRYHTTKVPWLTNIKYVSVFFFMFVFLYVHVHWYIQFYITFSAATVYNYSMDTYNYVA